MSPNTYDFLMIMSAFMLSMSFLCLIGYVSLRIFREYSRQTLKEYNDCQSIRKMHEYLDTVDRR